MPVATKKKSFFSPKVPSDEELERYCPNLEDELRECLAGMRHNQMLFDLETDPELVEERIYERQALLCRYRYLLAKAKKVGLHSLLGRCV